jgi:redox-sensitive bicupin YhaK (pirin superfamily)
MQSTISMGHHIDPVLSVNALGFPWKTSDPFLFCGHQDEIYPPGNDVMGPAVSLAGRNIGQDFAGIDGWRMYHGRQVPGFPQHPHRGFETVTIVRRGLMDHSDSTGAAARYGQGDVQWLTAGRGILHSEMSPLLDRERPNPVELFQIWVNLPSTNKLVDPSFRMFWADTIPRHVARDEAGLVTEVSIVAGHIGEQKAPAPPSNSWASRPDSDFAIWTIKMAKRAKWTLPAATVGTNRTLYFFKGGELQVADTRVTVARGLELRPQLPVVLQNGPEESELLLLQGRPINEPVVNEGPFVMNTQDEIRQTMREYQQTHFGGWPWPSNEPVHPREEGRFARRADGQIERPTRT